MWQRTTPEQGVAQYSFNVDDTVQSIRDARGATQNFTCNGRHLPTLLTFDEPTPLPSPYRNNVTATPDVAIGYDAAGNPTEAWDHHFQYDTTGQQTAATHPAYAVQSWYDGDRLRVQKTENGVTTYYVRSSVLGGAAASQDGL